MAQFVKGTSGGDYGEPAMLAVPPREQYKNEYTFVAPSVGEYNTFLTLVAEQVNCLVYVIFRKFDNGQKEYHKRLNFFHNLCVHFLSQYPYSFNNFNFFPDFSGASMMPL